MAVQGAVSEHADALRAAGQQMGIDVQVVHVRMPADLEGLAGLILPGGESTTMSRLLRSSGLQPILLERGGKDLALFGTCAGMILLCRDAVHDVADKDIQLLGLLDATVDRNAFGRQKDSFETDLEVEGIGKIHAVYIRAPVLTKVWGDTKALAHSNRGIVAAQKGRILATAFHPELSPSLAMHEAFLRLCQG